MRKFVYFLGIFSVFLCAIKGEAAVKKPPEGFEKSVIYQILLPSFTQEGTLNKAAEMLPYIKSLGVNIVYLCPIAEHDDHADLKFWSQRQKASRTNNPKNPYRIKDYFKVEADYGTPSDVKNFVEKAHGLGLKVIFDLVYYHCGPGAVFLKDNPDFVMRNPDGSFYTGEWCFPRLNFKNEKLRQYLISNMEHYVKEYGADGFRTDVGAMVPPDFWEEAYGSLIKLNPQLIMIEESERPSALEKVYDAIYEVMWQRRTIEVFHGKKPASILRERWENFSRGLPNGGKVLRAMENHDFANGPFRKRCELRFGYRGMDAVMVMNFTLDGIPFIYSGNEFADDAPMTIFSNRRHGRYFVEWANMLTEQGKRRMDLVKELIKLRQDPVFNSGETKWIDNDKPDTVLSYSRAMGGESALIVINAGDSAEKTEVAFDAGDFNEILSFGTKFHAVGGKSVFEMEPKGFAVLKGSK